MNANINDPRALLAQSTQTLRRWALARVTLLIALARARYAQQQERIPRGARVATQRFGRSMWSRVTARFPALAQWVTDLDVQQPATGTPSWSPPEAGLQQTQQAPARDIAALIAALRDPSAEVAAAAAVALAARAEPTLEPTCHAALLEVLENADGYFNPLTRVAALQSLALRFGGAPTGEELAPMLRAIRDVDAEVSLAAIAAVASCAPAEIAVDHLVSVMLDSSGYFLPLVRDAASHAMERVGLLTRHSA